jgi:hypothetical protein
MKLHARHPGGFFFYGGPMITFKSTEDLSKLPPSDPAFPTVKELVDRLITAYTSPDQPYNWQDYGYVILIEEYDAYRTLDEIWDGCTLLSIYWEGIMLRDGFFIAIYLANNEYGLVFVIPDAPWLTDDLRRMIEDTLDPLPEPSSINR